MRRVPFALLLGETTGTSKLFSLHQTVSRYPYPL